MKRLILSIAILVGLSVPAQAETDYQEWAKFIEKTWDCKAEIKQAGQFTGCSGFSLDYMHLMDDPNTKVNWDEAPTEYQTEIARIVGIDPENPEQDPADVMRVLDGVMVVALDFMCYSPEGKAWIVSEMVAGQKDQASIAGSLIALSMMNSIFCNLPVDTNFGALLENL